MRLDEIKRELQRLRETGERVTSNLVELEIDSSRQLLEARALTGESAARWAVASAVLTELWESRGLLEGFLERAEKLHRSPRHASELAALLSASSIELARAPVPLAERDLLGSSEVTVRCTPDELLERMSAAFDEVKTVVARFAQAWETLTPRLTTARALLEQAQALAAGVGESGRSDLVQASDRVARLAASLSSDPLSVTPADLDELTRSLEATRRDLEATAALRRDLVTRLADSRALLARLDGAIREGRTAHDELLVKIAGPSAPHAIELASGQELGDELDRIAALAASGAWVEARTRLERWTDRAHALLEDAERILRANRAPIEARNQLRSLLEAYQVKAARLGAIEDPQLERTFAQAQQALFTAPTDLALAAQLVRRYQEILNAPRAAAEVLP